LRARRDRVYELTASGQIRALQSVNVESLIRRHFHLDVGGNRIENPAIADIVVAVDGLLDLPTGDRIIALVNNAWGNAFVQAAEVEPGLFVVEYRDGPSQRQFKSANLFNTEVLKLVLLTYLGNDQDSMRQAIEWIDISAELRR
jgi:hypothetical protein